MFIKRMESLVRRCSSPNSSGEEEILPDACILSKRGKDFSELIKRMESAVRRCTNAVAAQEAQKTRGSSLVPVL